MSTPGQGFTAAGAATQLALPSFHTEPRHQLDKLLKVGHHPSDALGRADNQLGTGSPRSLEGGVWWTLALLAEQQDCPSQCPLRGVCHLWPTSGMEGRGWLVASTGWQPRGDLGATEVEQRFPFRCQAHSAASLIVKNKVIWSPGIKTETHRGSFSSHRGRVSALQRLKAGKGPSQPAGACQEPPTLALCPGLPRSGSGRPGAVQARGCPSGGGRQAPQRLQCQGVQEPGCACLH